MIKEMDKQFDFEQVGKRMPYNVPDGFFDQLEQNVMAETHPQPLSVREGSEYSQGDAPKAKVITPLHLVRGWGWASLAAAAAVTLFFVVTKNLPNDDFQADTFEFVELAYNNLSTEDQEFLLEVYEEDEFINDSNEEDYEENI